MGKMKVSKTVEKRIHITASGKILRRHQLASGHLKSNKSKNALNRAKKTNIFSSGDLRSIKRLLGV